MIMVNRTLINSDKGREISSRQKVFVYFDEDGVTVSDVAVPMELEDNFSMSVASVRGDDEPEEFESGNFTGFLRGSKKPKIPDIQDFGLGLQKPPARPRDQASQPRDQKVYQPRDQPAAPADDDEYPKTISKARLTVEKMREIYPNSKVYLRSVDFVSMRFEGWRKCRGDGNCYYRALGAAYIEHLARQTTSVSELDDFISNLAAGQGYYRPIKGFSEDNSDFCRRVGELRANKVTNAVASMTTAQSMLLSQEFDASLIKMMRVLTANSLVLNKQHPDIEPYAGEMLDYYVKNILKMGEDAEGLAFLCMAEALKVVIQHITIDRDTGVRSDYFRPLSSGRWPKLFVWLRPGHYDMIYSKEQMYTDGYSFEKRFYRPPELTNSDRVTLIEQLTEEVTVAPPPDLRVKLPQSFIEMTVTHLTDLYDSLNRAKDVEWVSNYSASFTAFKVGLAEHIEGLSESLPSGCLEKLTAVNRRLNDIDFLTKVTGLCRTCKTARASLKLGCGHGFCKEDLFRHVSAITEDKMLLALHEVPKGPLACPLCDCRLVNLDMERLLGDLYETYSRERQARSKEYEQRAMQGRGSQQCRVCGLWKDEAAGYLKVDYCRHACSECVRKLRERGELACREDGVPWPQDPSERRDVVGRSASMQKAGPAGKPEPALGVSGGLDGVKRQRSEEIKGPQPRSQEQRGKLIRVEDQQPPQLRSEDRRPQQSKLEQPRGPQPRLEDPRAPQPRMEDSRAPQPRMEDSRAPQPRMEDSRAPQPRIENKRPPQPKLESQTGKIKLALSKDPRVKESAQKCEGCFKLHGLSLFPEVYCKIHKICQNCYLTSLDGPLVDCPLCEITYEAALILQAKPKKTCRHCTVLFEPDQGIACKCSCEDCRDAFECGYCIEDFSPAGSPELEPVNPPVRPPEQQPEEEVKEKAVCSFCHDEVMVSSMKSYDCDHSFCRSCASSIEAMHQQSKDCPLCERRSARMSSRVSLRRLVVNEPLHDSSRQCPICMNKIAIDNIRTLDCDHFYCTSCLTEHITWKIKENDLNEGLKCPQCPVVIEGNIVEDLITDELFFKFNYFSIKRMYNVISCVMCKNEFVSGDARNVQCPGCKYQFCTECIEKAHKGNCKDWMIEKAVKELEETGEEVSQCPGCHHPYLKDEKCDHVKCINSKCLAEFCFECACLRLPTLHHGNHYHRSDCKHYFPPGEEPDEFKPDCPECHKTGELCSPPELLAEPRRFQVGET
jgi:hypothetical protein